MYVPIANQQGDQQEDCGTPMCSFQHCPICAWTKQASCAHVDVSPAWLKELRTNLRKGITRDLCNTATLLEVILQVFCIHTECQAESGKSTMWCLLFKFLLLNFHLFLLQQMSSVGSLKDSRGWCYDFCYPSLHFSPFLFLPFTGSWTILVHLFISFILLVIAYSGAEMHSTLTHEQPAYLCTARLPMHTLHIQYKDIMDALFL